MMCPYLFCHSDNCEYLLSADVYFEVYCSATRCVSVLYNVLDIAWRQSWNLCYVEVCLCLQSQMFSVIIISYLRRTVIPYMTYQAFCFCFLLGLLCKSYRHLDGCVPSLCVCCITGICSSQLCFKAAQGVSEAQKKTKETKQGTATLDSHSKASFPVTDYSQIKGVENLQQVPAAVHYPYKQVSVDWSSILCVSFSNQTS